LDKFLVHIIWSYCLFTIGPTFTKAHAEIDRKTKVAKRQVHLLRHSVPCNLPSDNFIHNRSSVSSYYAHLSSLVFSQETLKNVWFDLYIQAEWIWNSMRHENNASAPCAHCTCEILRGEWCIHEGLLYSHWWCWADMMSFFVTTWNKICTQTIHHD